MPNVDLGNKNYYWKFKLSPELKNRISINLAMKCMVLSSHHDCHKVAKKGNIHLVRSFAYQAPLPSLILERNTFFVNIWELRQYLRNIAGLVGVRARGPKRQLFLPRVCETIGSFLKNKRSSRWSTLLCL